MLASHSRTTRDSGLVILRCPSCAAAEPVPASSLAEGVGIVACGICGARWPVRGTGAARGGPGAEARSDDVQKPVPAPRAGSRAPPADPPSGAQVATRPGRVRKSRRRPLLAVEAIAATLFLAGFVLGREGATAAVPDLSGLYAAIGLSAGTGGLEVNDLAAERTEGGAVLALTGRLVNTSGRALRTTDMAVEIEDAAGRVVNVAVVAAPTPLLDAGTAAEFLYRLSDAPAHAAAVRVKLREGLAHSEALIPAEPEALP